MVNNGTQSLPRRWTAEELRKLPPGERDAILEVAARIAEHEYRTGPELTPFDAFGKDDLPVFRSRREG